MRRDRAAWRSRSQQGTRMPATAVTATASQPAGIPSEVDLAVPTTDSEQADNVQMTTIAATSLVPVHSSTSTVSAISESQSTVTEPGLRLFFLRHNTWWIPLGGFALGCTFLVLDILYHPKIRPSFSFYHSFALWFSLLGRLEEHLKLSIAVLYLSLDTYFMLKKWKGPQRCWYWFAIRLRRDEKSESNEPRGRDSSRAGSDRASAV